MDELVYEFDCGCRFKQYDTNLKDCDGLPPITIDYYNIRDCPRAWELMGTGRTKGVFQLEKNLGQTWSGELEPWNIEELSALISIIRPGVLKSFIDGDSLTKHFIERKHGREEAEVFHPALEAVLESTHYILVYQEQAMRIAQEIAGFDLKDADILRKAIGKKKADVMAKVKKMFMEGCEKQGIVTTEEAEEIFGWIQESQKYSFNLSHGVGYGKIGYWSAYVKAHFPLHFYASWLYYAKEKQKTHEEVEGLVSDTKLFNIEVYTPSLENTFVGNKGEFGITKKGVHFGIQNTQKVGKSHVNKFLREVNAVEKELGKRIMDWTWWEFLVFFSHKTNVTVVNNLISTGALAHMGLSRKRMLFEYRMWKKTKKGETDVGDREKKWIRENFDKCKDLRDALGKVVRVPRSEGGPSNKNRVAVIEDFINTIDNPSSSLEDTPLWIANTEKSLLGTSITCSTLDTCDTYGATSSCRDYLDGKKGKIVLAVEIKSTKEVTIKNGPSKGRPMAFVDGEDQSGRLDSMLVFADTWEDNKHMLYEGNTVLLTGQRSKKGDSFIINKIRAI